MRTFWLPLLCRLSAAGLLFQTTAPAVLGAERDRAAAEAGKKAFTDALAKASLLPPVMKGVPHMTVTPAAPPLPRVNPGATRSADTILNEVGRTDVPVSSAQRAAWRAELIAERAGKERQDRLRLWLAEADLAREYPQAAVARIDSLLKGRVEPKLRGLALHDRAEALFYMGRYGDARRAFETELRGSGVGFARQEAALWSRHARGCEGYHLDNERLGVPIPQRLDPLCGASAVATCLRALGLPHDQAMLARTVHHTGEGSNLQDLADACDRLGVAANPTRATEKGLRGLPLPVVAHVEGDHFVAVVQADKDGVEYVCSDCGVWPGGPVRVSWKAWHAMRPGAYMTVSKLGSPQQLAMQRLAPRLPKGGTLKDQTAPVDVSIAVTQNGLAGAAARIVTTLANNVAPLYLPVGYFCGIRPSSLHCPECGPCCPEDGPGGLPPQDAPWGDNHVIGNGPMWPFGPSKGDPVNLATGEEEYHPGSDLNVYNPIGPSVSWARVYNSLSQGSGGFGTAWSNHYNIYINTYGAPGGPVPYQAQVVFPNNARVLFTYPGPPSSSNPVVNCAVPAGYNLKIQAVWVSTSVSNFVVTFPDRSTWTFPCGAYGSLPILKVANRVGSWIGFGYTGASSPYFYGYLTSIYDSNGTSLLSIGRDANQFIVNVSDRYGRSVYYSKVASGVGAGELWQASQVVSTGSANPPVQYQYGYVDGGNGEATSGYPYLGSISVPSPTGSGMATASIAYDAFSGFVTSVTDANGNRREYAPTDWDGTADANKTTVKVKDPLGNLVGQYTVGFDGLMNQTLLRNAQGQNVWQKAYGSGGATYQPSSVTDGNGRIWSYTYDTFGNVLTSTTPKNTTITSSYDYSSFSLGELTSVKQGPKTATTFTYYEPSGLIHEIFSPLPGESGTGSVQATTCWYDSLGNVTQVTKPGNNAAASRSVYYAYTTDTIVDGDPAGSTYTQPEGLGRPIKITDSLGKVSHLRYDVRGNLASSTDPLGLQSRTSYNLADQPVGTSVPNTGNTGTGRSFTINTYLYPGGPSAQTTGYNESGTATRTVNLSYGPEGEGLSLTGSAEAFTKTYNPFYRVRIFKDGKNNLTSYSYDLNDHLTQVAYPGSTGVSYDKVRFTSYDAVGNLLSRTDGNGQITNYAYADTDGALSAMSYPGTTGNDVSLAYDAYDRPTSRTDSAGSYAWRYDDLGDRTGEDTSYTGISTQTVSFQYWPDGSRKTLTLPAGRAFGYTYDANGRCTGMSLYNLATGPSFTYYDNGWEASRTMPNGMTAAYTYNAVGRLAGLTNSVNSTTVSQYGSLGYDGVFNLTSLAASVPSTSAYSGTTTYGYDGMDRLTSESSTRLGGYSQTNAYDGAGNTTTLRGSTATFNANNQRTGTGYVYDGNGAPTTYNGAAQTYDVGGRLKTRPGGWSVVNRADGLRGWKNFTGGTLKYYLYVDGKPWMEINSTSQPDALNVWAPDGLVGRNQGGPWEFYAYDTQGNVAQRTNGAGTVLSSSVYDAYGNETYSGTRSEIFGYNARWGYASDRETGLVYCQNRYYDPVGGRWVTRDPIGQAGGTNLYGYCQGRPVNWTDPNGLRLDSVSAYCSHFPSTCVWLAGVLGTGGTALGQELGAEGEEISEETIEAISNLTERQFGNLMHRMIQNQVTQLDGWRAEVPCDGGRMDLANRVARQFIEIKPGSWGGFSDGRMQSAQYTAATGYSGTVIYYPAPWSMADGEPIVFPFFDPFGFR